jgi:hypothetical protein
MKERRGHWYLLTGLALGLVVGLLYAWLISPVKYINSSPASLKTGFKEQYRALIAAAYAADNNLTRAKARLELLGETDVPRLLAEQAQRTLAEGGSQNDARALGLLAVALGQGPTPLASNPLLTEIVSPIPSISLTNSSTDLFPNPTIQPSGSPTTPFISQTVGSATEITVITNTSVSNPNPTIFLTLTTTPIPIRTPTPTPQALFVVRTRTFICDPNLSEPIIMVNTYGDKDQPVPGVEVIVSWDGGEDYFFTGLKPELGVGYADYTMIPGTSYILRLADGGEMISGLISSECQVAGESNFWGSWLVVFEQP